MTNDTFSHYRKKLDIALAYALPKPLPEHKMLFEALRYSALNPGKRFRPLLVYLTGEMLGASEEVLTPPACAVELIHCYSLIHDDLPAMDDADLRRGKPSCHKAFNEAIAILAGDGLLTLAFEVLSTAPLDAEQRCDMIRTLSQASGPHGMVGGQAIDICNQITDEKTLWRCHALKTGALIQASVLLGGIAGKADTRSMKVLEKFGEALGQLFQMQDDILDVTENTQTLGKTAGIDETNDKTTYVTLLGLEEAKEKVKQLTQETKTLLMHFENHDSLLSLVDRIIRA
ncbi:MAG: polyprenyl synthetase family protein [Gammaproteobacteria bacterium]